MLTVYILLSESDGKHYVGHTEDIDRRILEHNNGRSPYTRSHGPWVLVYREEFGTRGEAMIRERQIKGRKSKK